jgi:hypothetical protein
MRPSFTLVKNNKQKCLVYFNLYPSFWARKKIFLLTCFNHSMNIVFDVTMAIWLTIFWLLRRSNTTEEHNLTASDTPCTSGNFPSAASPSLFSAVDRQTTLFGHLTFIGAAQSIRRMMWMRSVSTVLTPSDTLTIKLLFPRTTTMTRDWFNQALLDPLHNLLRYKLIAQWNKRLLERCAGENCIGTNISFMSGEIVQKVINTAT